jgi:hypothetical protein
LGFELPLFGITGASNAVRGRTLFAPPTASVQRYRRVWQVCDPVVNLEDLS